MNLLRPKYLKYVVLGLISALVVTCWPRKEKPQGHPRDYAEIKKAAFFMLQQNTTPSASMWMEIRFRDSITN